MTDLQRDILYILRTPDADFTIQRLDRALVQRWDPAVVVRGLLPALRELEAAGLVRSTEHVTDGARHTLYRSTDAGRRRAAEAAAPGAAA